MMVPETHLLYKEFNGVKRLAISYSQIDTFLTCPMKWYKTYVEGKRSTENKKLRLMVRLSIRHWNTFLRTEDSLLVKTLEKR